MIMVVEDNPTNMKLVHMVLARGGYSVREATGAEEAIIAIRADPPDLVLMDVQLPGMDGFEAMAMLKADPSTAAIPVVALTAFAMHGDEEKILAAGFDAYMAKPIRYNELLVLVGRLLASNAKK
jgi:two-component system cell cycle response regulator DivK